jgi:peptidoglycan/xylan/chitin deacetylase (PgdA/CDA1 family)
VLSICLILFALLAVLAGVPLVLFYGATIRRGPHRAELALTIDDGPDPSSTPALLAALAEAGIVATFFCPTAKLAAQPALAVAMARGGHELANHSHRHPWHLALFSERAARAELDGARQVLAEHGVASRWFRPVAGVVSPPLLRAARALDLRLVTWTARARDGGGTRVAPATAMRRLRPGLVPGGILLLHDRDGAPGAAVVGQLKRLADERGLAFVKLSDLLR